MHNHQHKHCQHQNIKYCTHCQRPYCPDCGQEWYQWVWYYNSYPSWGTQWTYTSPTVGNGAENLGTLTTTEAPKCSHHSHGG